MAKVKDLTGMVFGKLTVLSEYPEPYIDKKGRKVRRWVCRCECGKRKVVAQNALITGNTKSCGCAQQVKRLKDHVQVGDRFGLLTVEEIIKLNESGKKALLRDTFYRCKCDCGNEVTLSHIQLKRGKKTCGCYAKGRRAATGGAKKDSNSMTVANIKQRRRKDNKTGQKGVSYEQKIGKFRADIAINGVSINLGIYDTFAEACAARKVGEKLFHKPLLREAAGLKPIWDDPEAIRIVLPPKLLTNLYILCEAENATLSDIITKALIKYFTFKELSK